MSWYNVYVRGDERPLGDTNMTKRIPWTLTAYKGKTVKGEKNDCVVRAAMTSTGKSYLKAHAWAASIGRVSGRGISTNALIRYMSTNNKLLGADITPVEKISRDKKKSLAVFLRENPKGHFFCLMRSHAFAVVDGKAVDTWRVPGGSRIYKAWHVGKTYKSKKVLNVKEKRASRKVVAERRAKTRRCLRFQFASSQQPRTATEMMKAIGGDVETFRDITWLCQNDTLFKEVAVCHSHYKHYVLR